MRATHDLDFLVLIDEPNKEELIAKLSSSGITINQQWAAANPMARTRVTRFTARGHPNYPLDIIYASDQHERQVLNRAQGTTLFNVSFPVVTAEDLILLKLKASRPTDFDDVISIVKNPRLQLDLIYLWNWADRLVCKENCSTFSRRRVDKVVGERDGQELMADSRSPEASSELGVLR